MPTLKPDILHRWQARERWSYLSTIHETIAQEKTHEETLMVEERHAEMRWNRVRVRWATKHLVKEFDLVFYV